MYLDENGFPAFFWTENYQVDMRPIWKERMAKRIEKDEYERWENEHQYG